MSLKNSFDIASATLMVALILLAAVRALSPWPLPVALGAGLMILYILVTLPVARPVSRIMALALFSVSLTIAWIEGLVPLVFGALDNAVLFAGFLAVVSMIRQVARRDPAIRSYRQRLEAETRLAARQGRPGSRRPKILSGSFVVGGFLSMGSSALFATLLPKTFDDRQRAAEGRACATGTGLAITWSPFFVGMAVVSSSLPQISLVSLILGGGVLGVMGLMIYALLDSRLDGPRQVLRGFALARRLLLPVLFAAFCIATVAEVGRMSTLESMVIVLPTLCLIRLAMIGPLRLKVLRADLGEDLLRLRGELVVVASALVLGSMVGASSIPALAGEMARLDGLPPFVLSLGGILGMAAIAISGLHPLICGTVALGIFSGTEHALTTLQVGLTVLAGWGMSSMLSVSGFLLQVTAGQYRVPVRGLLAPSQFLFLALHAPAAAFVIALIGG